MKVTPHDDGWIEVEDDDLDQPVRLRLGVNGSRFVVLALKIDNGIEITSNTLRRIRLAQALDEFGGWLQHDRAEAATWQQRLADHLDRRRAAGVTLSAEDLKQLTDYSTEVSATWATWQRWLDQLDDVEPMPLSRGRGAKPPSEDELRQFARTYLEELVRKRRGALGRTASRIGMHRVTANLWVKRCRAAGYLPEEETGGQ